MSLTISEERANINYALDMMKMSQEVLTRIAKDKVVCIEVWRTARENQNMARRFLK
jgi:hypothetical protein